MRHNCTSCARKHLAQALVLMIEALKGYPEHGWIAAGHMAEAEDELLPDYIEIAHAIRRHRTEYMIKLVERDPAGYSVPIMDLIETLNQTDIPYEQTTDTDLPDAPGLREAALPPVHESRGADDS